MHPYKRSERIGELILAEIAELLTREIKDPRIGFVTFTRVEMSDDLRHAKVFVSSFGAEPEIEFAGVLSNGRDTQVSLINRTSSCSRKLRLMRPNCFMPSPVSPPSDARTCSASSVPHTAALNVTPLCCATSRRLLTRLHYLRSAIICPSF